MAIRSQVNADAAAVQAFGGGTQLQQSLDVLSMQLCCLQHICQPNLHHIQLEGYLKHLPNLETCFCCPQAFLSVEFQCKDDISELK